MKQNQSTTLNALQKSVMNVIKCGTTLGKKLMQISGVLVANTTHTKKRIFKQPLKQFPTFKKGCTKWVLKGMALCLRPGLTGCPRTKFYSISLE